MPALFIELFSEEIPARMQARAAADLGRLVCEALGDLKPENIRVFSGPRRIAMAAELQPGVAASRISERGPRVGAPEQALAGFLRKHGAAREALREEGAFWALNREGPAVAAADLIAAAMPALLRRFPWPKSMRWGGTSTFTWVRPLRRIVCLLDKEVVPFTLAANDDDAHGLASGCETEGHRVHAPGAFAVSGVADWERKLAERHVLASAEDRRRMVSDGIATVAAAHALCVVDDPGLIDEVAGLVEWPVVLLGRIDDAFMDLPAEVMQVSMRVNQRYFAMRHADGRAAPWFAFAANLVARDGGAAIVAGNERVLRARFSDARHFWNLDRETSLAERVEALDGITFHKKLGSQRARVQRIVSLAEYLAPLTGSDAQLARQAAELAKADLSTGMVGEFPELQGVMGGYYARHDGLDGRVADAVRDHYLPKGPSDAVPRAPISVVVALADKIDQLVSFFAIGEAPTGSSDPFALRRAALGVIRIVRENALRLDLDALLAFAAGSSVQRSSGLASQVRDFILERLRVLVKGESGRAEILGAALGGRLGSGQPWAADIVRLLRLAASIETFVETDDGKNLLAAYKRAVNILRIEEAKDGPVGLDASAGPFATESEAAFHAALATAYSARRLLADEDFEGAMTLVSRLRLPLDAFFDNNVVNDPDPAIRLSRLGQLARLRLLMAEIADFSKIDT